MTDLPDDVYLAIFSFLDLTEILIMRMVNKNCLRVTHAAAVWKGLLKVQIVEKRLPVPGLRGTNIEDLPQSEVERMLRRAIELRRNWKSPSPVANEELTLKALDVGRIIFLEFVRRPGYSWLVSVSVRVDTPQRRQYTLECWDVAGAPRCIARRVFHQFLGLVLNQCSFGGQNSSDVAVQAPFITTYAIRPSPADPEAGFHPTAQFLEREERLHLFCGTRMLTSSLQEGQRLLVWDTRFPRLSLELHHPGLGVGHSDPLVLAATFRGQYVAIVRQGTCELYSLPPLEAEGYFAGAHRTIHPLREHVWPWRIDSVVLSPTVSDLPRQSQSRPSGIGMLIRFQSGYPWVGSSSSVPVLEISKVLTKPINLLHQFDLHPNPQGDVPYQFPPVIRQTIAAPLRMFAQTDMALGSHGTAVWIDSHTEDYFGHADRGQRLASRTPLNRGNVPDAEDQDPSQQNANVDEDISDHVATTMEASAMRWDELDNWVKLAVDEEEGKVALGCKDGSGITLLSFV